jgi:4-hydroxy-2-oxoheptanedioate aldolase
MTDQPYLDQPNIHANAPYRAALLTQPGNLRQALRDAVADPKKTLFGVAHGIPSTFVTKVGTLKFWTRGSNADFISLVDCVHEA